MGRGSRGGDDWSDRREPGGEWVRPIPADEEPRRGPSRFERGDPRRDSREQPAYDSRYDHHHDEQQQYDRRFDSGEQPAYDPRYDSREQPAYDPRYDQPGSGQAGYEQGGYQQGWDEGTWDPPGAEQPRGGGVGRAATGAWDQGGYDYDRGFSGWTDHTEPTVRGFGRDGRGGGTRLGEGGILPDALPVVPTLLAALVAVVFAFIIGRATAGGGDDGTAQNTVKTVESTTTISAAPLFHTVGDNETLSAIASQYGISPDELAAANDITNVNHVFVGQRLLIPSTPGVSAATTTTRVPSTQTTKK